MLTLKISSLTEIAVLKEAVEYVTSFEGDMIKDSLERLTASFDDQTLDEVVDMRAHVRAGQYFLQALEHTKPGAGILVDRTTAEVLDRGLEFMKDQLGEATSEPFLATDIREAESITKERVKRLEEEVDTAVDKLVSCIELLFTIRAKTKSL